MENNEILALIDKYQAGKCSNAELEMLDKWYNELNEIDKLSSNESINDASIADEMWTAFKDKAQITDTQFKKLNWFKLSSIAAAAVILLVSGLVFFNKINTSADLNNTSKLLADVTPGQNKATLILGDGTKINLDQSKKGILANQAGYEVVKLADGQIQYKIIAQPNAAEVVYNTIVTPNAGQYQIVLPDGTKVWLNAASSLKYPSAFVKNTRNVELEGEGYFEVAKNAKMPFVVKTHGQEIEVLGTHFNINSYRNEPSIKTTLLEGSVKVHVKNQNFALKPGELAQTDLKYHTQISKTNAIDAIAWKEGFFKFKRSDIYQVMRDVARWYDLKIIYDGDIKSAPISGKIYRNVNLDEILETISYLGLEFKIQGRELTISAKP
jgi:transmembrane sensor